MNPLITPEMLAMTGIEIGDDEVEAYLIHLNDQLTERIGESVTNSLSEDQLKELSELQDTSTDEELNQWLQKNVKELDAIIQDEIDILLGDAAENSDEINSLDK
jgi:hypothetical protein